jgi:cell division septal protein FtsQ
MVLIGVGLGMLFLLQQLFHIKVIHVKSPSRATEIQSQAHKLVAEQWRQQNLLTLNSNNLEDALLKADPMVKAVRVQRQWPNAVTLAVTLKQPSLGWMSGNQAYLLDRDGSAIGLLPSGASVPVVVDGSNLPVRLGQRVTSTRFIGFTTELATALAAAKVTATRYEVKDTTLDLYVTTAKGYRLIFDTSRSAREQAADLSTLLGFLAKQNKAPVEYIDLRIAGKAYYK